MKAITLWQPWASLIAEGAKRYETRSWKPYGPYLAPGELLAIHAGQIMVPADQWGPAVVKAVKDIMGEGPGCMPLGAVLCVMRFEGALRTHSIMSQDPDWAMMDEQTRIMEMGLGDFAPGRYAWKLEPVVLFRPPIAAKGAQRLWEFDLDEALALAEDGACRYTLSGSTRQRALMSEEAG